MSGEKTEQPTPKKLRDARKKGQVAKSKEICSAAIIAGLFICLWMGGDYYLASFQTLMLAPVAFLDAPFEQALIQVMSVIGRQAAVLIFPFVAAAFALAFLANFLQVGGLFAIEPIVPSLKKLNPVEGFKRIFSLNNLMELLKSIFKIGFLGVVIGFIIYTSIDMLIKIPHTGIRGVVDAVGELMKKMILAASLIFILVALADHFLQKFLHTRKLKMTKDEVKREHKQMEGDPTIKSKRKQLHQEMAMGEAGQKVKKSSVVVTNPTRLAVALAYEKGRTKLPLVMAMGENLTARIMVEAARENHIPVMQNVPLAWSLFETAQVDQYIPSELIEPVAEVLRWVMQLSGDHTEIHR